MSREPHVLPIVDHHIFSHCPRADLRPFGVQTNGRRGVSLNRKDSLLDLVQWRVGEIDPEQIDSTVLQAFDRLPIDRRRAQSTQ